MIISQYLISNLVNTNLTNNYLVGDNMEAANKIGELDPDTCIGFATITEHVVIDVLGDAIKEKFGSPYDLISESLGKVNVKYSALRRDHPNHVYWNFSKGKNSKTPDNYVCLGMDKHNTEITRVWIIPGDSEVVKEKGITVSPRRDKRLKRYEVDSAIYDKTFQEMDINSKPEFRNTTKPKISRICLSLKQIDLEYEKEMEILKNQPPSKNLMMLGYIKDSAPLQRFVLLNVVKIAQKHKLPLEYSWVINRCLNLADGYNLSYVSFNRVKDSISLWSTCGVIKTKYPKIKAIHESLDDIEEAIYEDPEFLKFKDD